jgi:hypothetical protein
MFRLFPETERRWAYKRTIFENVLVFDHEDASVEGSTHLLSAISRLIIIWSIDFPLFQKFTTY